VIVIGSDITGGHMPEVRPIGLLTQASRPGATRTARSFDPPSCQDIAKPAL
jgi:hypothetical protein